MGRIFWRERADGTRTAYAHLYDRAGKRKQVSLRTSDAKVARAKLRDLELRTTDHAPTSTTPLTEAIDYFLNVTHAGSPKATVRCYRQKARHLARLIGPVPCDEFRLEHAQRYIATRLTEGAHPHTVHKELVVLRGALKSARARDLFHRSASDVVPTFDPQYEPRKTWLTPEQFDALVEHLAAAPYARMGERGRVTVERRRQERALYCIMIAFASPRRGEMAKLQPSMVDLRNGLLYVPKAKTRARTVPIHPTLRPYLEGWVEGRLQLRAWGNVGRDLPAACKRAGVPRCTPNDLRRTFGSWLVQAGVPLKVVAELMGNSVKMVDLVYGQLSQDNFRSAIAALPGASDTAGTPPAGGRPVGHNSHAGASQLDATTGTDGEDVITVSAPTIGNLVPRGGIEPPTRGFSVRCSTG
jgi:integrase